MVAVSFSQSHRKLTRSLEMYLIQANNFALNGNNYRLILLVSNDDLLFNSKRSLILSAKVLDDKRERQVIQSILKLLQHQFSPEELSAISSINVVNSNAPLVRNLNTLPREAIQDREVDINTEIGGVSIRNGTLISSSILSNLVAGKRRVVKLSSGEVLGGIIRKIDKDYLLSVETINLTTSEINVKTCFFSDIVSVHHYAE